MAGPVPGAVDRRMCLPGRAGPSNWTPVTPRLTPILRSPWVRSLRILGGAVLNPSSFSLSVSNLTIDSNSALSSGSSSTLTLNVSNRADIAGRISADGPGTTSQGIGQTSSSGSGGGGHGGYGGRGAGSLGGLAYDSASSPLSTGSRGGGNLVVAGSGGGGALRMTVAGVLALNGLPMRIEARK